MKIRPLHGFALLALGIAGRFGSTEETDGIALDNRDFGPDFPTGLFIAKDGMNAPQAQNFKYARWDEVLAALGERK